MKQNNHTHKWQYVFFFMFLGVALLFVLSKITVYTLNVKNMTQNVMLRSKPTCEGEEFTLNFINSVVQLPVEEKYKVEKDNGIVLEETTFESLGPGLPNPLAHSGIHLIMVGEKKMKLVKINQKIGTLRVLVSYLNPMALVFDNAIIPLDKQCNGGDLIEISVNKSSYLAYWKTKLW